MVASIYIKRVMGFCRSVNTLQHQWQGYHKVGWSKDAMNRDIDGSLSHKSVTVMFWEGDAKKLREVEEELKKKTSALAFYNLKWNKSLTSNDVEVTNTECYYFPYLSSPEDCEFVLQNVIQGYICTKLGAYIEPIVCINSTVPDAPAQLTHDNNDRPVKKPRTEVQLESGPIECLIFQDYYTKEGPPQTLIDTFYKVIQRDDRAPHNDTKYRDYARKTIFAALINLRRWYPTWNGKIETITDEMVKPFDKKYMDLYCNNFSLERTLAGSSTSGGGSMHSCINLLRNKLKNGCTVSYTHDDIMNFFAGKSMGGHSKPWVEHHFLRKLHILRNCTFRDEVISFVLAEPGTLDPREVGNPLEVWKTRVEGGSKTLYTIAS